MTEWAIALAEIKHTGNDISLHFLKLNNFDISNITHVTLPRPHPCIRCDGGTTRRALDIVTRVFPGEVFAYQDECPFCDPEIRCEIRRSIIDIFSDIGHIPRYSSSTRRNNDLTRLADLLGAPANLDFLGHTAIGSQGSRPWPPRAPGADASDHLRRSARAFQECEDGINMLEGRAQTP